MIDNYNISEEQAVYLIKENIPLILNEAFASYFSTAVELCDEYQLLPNDKSESVLAAGIHILGEWCGSVSLECHYSTALSLVSKIFSDVEQNYRKEVVCDTLGELINVIGGNLKTVLGENCALSTPKVTELNNFGYKVNDSHVIFNTKFKFAEQILNLTIYQAEKLSSLADL